MKELCRYYNNQCRELKTDGKCYRSVPITEALELEENCGLECPWFQQDYIKLKDVLDILKDKNFAWWRTGINCKYLSLYLDTRMSNLIWHEGHLWCLLKDKTGKPLSLDELRKGIKEGL